MSYTRQQYIDLIHQLLPDNASQLISPQDLRTSLLALIDSIENFVVDDTVNTLNLGTEDFRNTRVGNLALDKIRQNVPNTSGEDNTAVGYYALGGNYISDRNTAVGAYSMGCNLYGNNNVAVGFNSLAGNIDGSGNVIVGNYALRSNKFGDFNVALGHAAGYYLGPNYNHKLIIGINEVDAEDICEPTSIESGKAPLVYGDFKDYKLGIAVKDLNNYGGTLQVSGDITPYEPKSFGIGNVYYPWNDIYVSSGIAYSASGDLFLYRYSETFPFTHTKVATFAKDGNIAFGNILPSGSQGFITIDGHIVPAADKIYRLGHPDLKWDAVFNDIVVSGNATINDLDYVNITSNLYEQKTLHLATSGECYGDIFESSICAYLTDEALDGAGLMTHASGVGYKRDYYILYKFPDQTINCLEIDDAYSRARWQTNISFEIQDGRHLKTQRILSKDRLSFVSESGCYGLFIRPHELSENDGNKVSFSQESDLDNIRGDFNIIHPSGFTASFASKSSGIKTSLELVSRLENTVRGFALTYSDDKDVTDNLTIGAIGSNNKITLNRLAGSGVFGVTNRSGNIFPATIFNVQSSGIADARISSSGLNRSSIELLANGNEKASGIEFVYTPIAGQTPLLDLDGDSTSDNSSQTVFDVSLLLPSGSTYSDLGAISVATNGYVGIGRTKYNSSRIFQPNAPLTISNITKSSGTISMREQSVKPDFTSTFGKIYVKPSSLWINSNTYYNGTNQKQSLFFVDDAGNEFNLIRNSSNTRSELVYSDNNGNTYAGINCPASRPTPNAYRNTAYGNSGLYSVTTGSDNIIFGTYSASKITTGSKNVVIGSESLDSITSTSSSANVLIGYRNLYQTPATISNAIAIGSGLNPSNYGLLIGYGPNPLISGSLSDSNRTFILKSTSSAEAIFGIDSRYNEQSFSIENAIEYIPAATHAAVLKLKDNTSAPFSPNFISLRFEDQNNISKTLVDFVYNANPINKTPIYAVASPVRPYVGISGDIRLLGAIRFANGTSIEDGDVDIELNFIDLPSAFDTPNTITTQNSYLALSVPSGNGGDHYVGKVTLQSIGDLIGSGFASVSENCNHIWSNAENAINRLNNSNSVFIGCDVATAATGWKHSVMIGSEAGAYATTPNIGLATDTASIFIGYKAGYDADQVSNTICIGTNAGNSAASGQRSIFIGSNAGQHSSHKNSIGLGFNALRGDVSTIEIGERNIEIVTGLNDNQRLFYNAGNLSDRLNIQNTIAGNTLQRRISIGSANLDPTAVLSVRKDARISGHTTTDYIQDWWCTDAYGQSVMVAAIDCNGNFIVNPDNPTATVLEGITVSGIPAPTFPSTPTSGLFRIKTSNWANNGQAYLVNRDPTLNIPSGAFVVVNYVNNTYRPVWVSCSGEY